VRILHMTDLLFELVENLRCDMVFIKQAFSSAYYLLRTEYCSEEVGACPQAEMTERHHTHHTYTAPAQPVIASRRRRTCQSLPSYVPRPSWERVRVRGLIAR